MSVNNYRKCAKCGKTRVEDMSVTYHRFPNPGTTNLTKARAWATYCWPHKDWTSIESLRVLYSTSKVLCGRHFKSSQFHDNQRQKLSKFAVPDSTEVNEVLNDRENIFSQNVEQSSVTQLTTFRVALSQIDNNLVQPSTSSGLTHHALIEALGTEKPIVQNIEQPMTEQFKVPMSQKDIFVEPSTSAAFPTQQTVQTLITTKPSSLIAQCVPVKPSHSTRKKRGPILTALNISKLSEMTPRELKLYKIYRNKVREILRLRKQLKNKKGKLKQVFDNENIQKLCNLNISNSFITLLQSQLQNCPKKPKGRRYNLKQKIMALVIYKKSPAGYRLLRRMFALPSQTSLIQLLNKVPLKTGINKHIFDSLNKMTQRQVHEDNICILSFDEVSIRKHLYYDVKLDQIHGYQDHGNHGRSSAIASKAAVFMLHGLRKQWKQPIAFYFSHTLNADRMVVILKEILMECFSANLNVVATVCDLSTVNIKVLKTLGATTREPYFSISGREIVTVLDPPHLLKCTRNMLMKHNVECETTDVHCNEKIIKGTVKWSHLENFYKLDKDNPNFVHATALTDYHMRPNSQQQMRVKLAAQVFSHSVASGMIAKIATNELPTEAHATYTFVKKFDQLFDAVNADSPDLRRGKKYSTNIKPGSPHFELFAEMRKYISSMKYIGAKNNPPSQEGWIHTMNAIERLFKNLVHLGIRSLPTRRLNQDVLENCFGCIRYSCGSNNNPTVQQFISGVKTAIISNLKHSGLKKNCEDDTDELTNNLSDFLTSSTPFLKDCAIPEKADYFDDRELETFVSDAVEAVEQGTSEGQACGYVCGFIYKKLQTKNCINCQKAFLTNKEEIIHIFTSFKEYSDKKSLNYVNKEMVICVETMATLINEYLKSHGEELQLKSHILNILENVDLNFLNKCVEHKENNINHVKICTFFICIKRFCIKRNRQMEDDEKKKSLERKIRILMNK